MNQCMDETYRAIRISVLDPKNANGLIKDMENSGQKSKFVLQSVTIV